MSCEVTHGEPLNTSSLPAVTSGSRHKDGAQRLAASDANWKPVAQDTVQAGRNGDIWKQMNVGSVLDVSDAWKAVMTIIADPSRVVTAVSVSAGLEWKMNACRVFWRCLENGNSNLTTALLPDISCR